MTRSELHFDQSLPAVYGIAQRLSPRIERLLARNPSPFTFRGTGVYLVGDARRVAVIDPGPNDPEHIQSLLAAIGGREVEHILITHTHRDHSPAAAALKKATGAKTYGFGPHARHGGDVEEGGDHDFVPDIAVRDGDVIAGGAYQFHCVFTPGHTSNHMCYALEEDLALFTGDHVMGWSTTVVAPPDGDMGAYMISLEKLIARKDRVLYPTHGSPITRPKPFLRAYLSHRKMREAQIMRAIKRGENTVPLLVGALYPGLSPALARAAGLTVEAHLLHMADDKRVRSLPNGRYELSEER
ncbi:MAG TPA: MBL fold metallo-hydrolase [Rhizomicrobium sp.]|nr:MBL fold metallo-hydrolase [Rhizomicrobium sp.]